MATIQGARKHTFSRKVKMRRKKNKGKKTFKNKKGEEVMGQKCVEGVQHEDFPGGHPS